MYVSVCVCVCVCVSVCVFGGVIWGAGHHVISKAGKASSLSHHGPMICCSI